MIAAMAELWQVPVAPHNPSGPVANVAILRLAARTPNFTLLETMATDVPWRKEIVMEEAEVHDSRVMIPTKPGLVIDLDESVLERFPYVRHDLRHNSGALTEIRPPDAVVRGAGQA